MDLNINQCIYCGARETLTREHVMPRGLGGDEPPGGYSDALVLQRASCERCRLITERFERHCLQSGMDSARATLGLKRRDRSGSTMRVQVGRSDPTNQVDVPISEGLGVVVIPGFDTAGAFAGRPLGARPPCDMKVIVVSPAARKLVDGHGAIGVRLSIDPMMFAQMLAKIALGLAVAHLGITGFEPLVREMIVSAPETYGHWVGGFPDDDFAPDAETPFHQITMMPQDLVGGKFLVACIRLFAQYGGPLNYVVVGKLPT